MDFFSIPDRFNLKKQKKRIYYTPITPETGEMAEWPKAAVSKTVNGVFPVRGFESPSLRHFYAQILTKCPHFSPLGVAKCPLLCYN